jgi:hypothetical protein
MAEPGVRVSIRHEDFDLGAEVAALRAGDGGESANTDHRPRDRSKISVRERCEYTLLTLPLQHRHHE